LNSREAGRYWNGNAAAWTQLARAGYDVYRDFLNTPAFLTMLPDVAGLEGLDVGCGEGHNTRLLAERGARMTALDIAGVFVAHAVDAEREAPRGIRYVHADGADLPFPDETFDFAAGFMSFMDIPDLERVVRGVWRVLRPGGFLQFSISHPCYDTPRRRNLRDESGVTYACEIGDYFRGVHGEIDEWLFSSAPPEVADGLPKFRVPRFTRTLGQWLNLLIDAGFVLERVEEPCPDDDIVRACPKIQDAQVIAYFLHVRVRKPPGL